MKKLSILLLTLLLATNCYAVAPDIRISDDEGHVMSLNSDGSLKATTSGWTGGNVVNCAATDATTLQACITAASAGGKIVLPAGTITVNSEILLNKPITLESASRYGTNINSTSAAAFNIFHITSSSVHFVNTRITHSTNLTSGTKLIGVFIDGPNSVTPGGTAGDIIIDVSFENSSVTLTGNDAKQRTGVYIVDASVGFNNSGISLTNAANGEVIALQYQGSSTQEANTTLTLFNSIFSTNGTGATGTTANIGMYINNNNSPSNLVVSCYMGQFLSYPSSSSTLDDAIYIGNTTSNNKITAAFDKTLIQGADYDINIATGNAVVSFYNTILTNNTTNGTTISNVGTVRTSKLNVNFTTAAGADTACNTTCGTANCVAGYDITTTALVNCANAAADSCICS